MRLLPTLLLLPWLILQSSAHLHIQVRYNAGWDLFLYDFEAGEFPSDAFPIHVSPAAFSTVAADPRYTNLFGPTGTAVWVLPQNEKSGVTFLGIGAELSSSTFVGNQLQLLLRSVTGPGDFILYATDSFGSPQVHMNSRDGLGSADVLTLTSASHLHLNWAFTKAGTYTIGLSASGTLHNQVITNSPTSHFTFHVVQPSAPILQILDRHETAITCRLLADPYVLCTLETTSDLTNWHSWTNISVQGGDTAIFNLKLGSPPSVQLIRSVIR